MWATALIISLVFSAQSTLASAANCQFVFGFKALHDLIPGVIGDCSINEYFNVSNGDSLQPTSGLAGGTGGLLVWRKADNWTAYTDGYHTWINGPYGLQERLNTQRFSWEVAPPAPAPVAVPSPAPITTSAARGLYHVALTRLDQDFYRDDGGTLFETIGCYEYAYSEPAIFDADHMLIQFSSATCSASNVATQYLRSRINGTFNGFAYEAAFSLTNGQVWQEVSATYQYHYYYLPEVYIYVASGAIRMHVVGVDTTINVRRLS